MVLNKRLSGYFTLAILTGLIGACVSSAEAAGSAMIKRVPPSNILAGSTLTKGRVFYQTSIPENTLAGIRLGAKALAVLSKWGNPTRITVGGAAAAQPPAGTAAGPGMGMGMGPGMGMGMGPGMGVGMAAPAGAMSPAMMAGGARPMAGGAAAPGGPMTGMGMGMAPGMGPGMMGMGMGMGAGAGVQSAAASPTLSPNEVVWTYDLPTGISLEFVVTENVVTQITVAGLGPWALSKTRLGLQLGDSYKLVIWAAGYPESQEYSGKFLRMSYVNKYRALFTLDKNKVVGITIALDPNNVH